MSQPEFEIHPSVLSGETSDIYFLRAREILEKEGINPVATMEVFPSRDGMFCGIREVKALLDKALPQGSEVWALSEGETMQRKEVTLRITAPYQSYGIYETAIVGILAHCSGWATAARECADAAQGIPVISFGARHVHPLVAGIMEYAAVIGGCTSCSSVAGASLAGVTPTGTMPHALIIVMGDTAKATLAFDKHMPPDVPRISLVDTFKDEAEESVIVAQAMEGRLSGVRLDTPSERGGVTADLVREVRAKLDLAGFKEVGIFVSGGLSPDRIRYFREGKPIAKRGRIPGITPNPKLKRIL